MRKSSRSILIISIALFIVGGVLTGVGVAMGGSVRNWPNQGWTNNISRYVRVPGWGWDWSRGWDSVHLSDHSETLDSFSNISMDTNLGEIIIDYGSEYRIDFKNCAMSYLSWSVTNGSLIITERGYEGKGHGNGLDWGGESSIRITVPTGTVLTGLSVSHDLGSLTNRVPIKGERVYVDLNLGSAWLNDVCANRVELSLDLGELTATNIVADRFTAKLNVGSASIRGIAARNLDIDCDLGSLNLNIIGLTIDYSYDLKTGLGNATLDGSSLHGSGGHRLNDSSRPYRLEASVDLGELNVTFTSPEDADPFAALQS